jgi:hypothetical protein
MYCYSTFLFHYYYYSYYSSTHFCPLYFSEMPWSNFMKPCRNIICHMATILNFFNPPKSCHTLRWIFLQSFMKFDERNPKKILFPLFLFPWPANIKKKIVRNSKMKRFQWKWICTRSKTCHTIWWPFWFAMGYDMIWRIITWLPNNGYQFATS